MIARKFCLPALLIASTAAQAATLPLKPGTYVAAGTPCKDPPFAAMFGYDGRQFSYPHAAQCRSVIRAHPGKTYRVQETCSALGDGTPTKPDTMSATYTVLSPRTVAVNRGTGKDAIRYRWCPAPWPRHGA
jgi:hypothetical protein